MDSTACSQRESRIGDRTEFVLLKQAIACCCCRRRRHARRGGTSYSVPYLGARADIKVIFDQGRAGQGTGPDRGRVYTYT